MSYRAKVKHNRLYSEVNLYLDDKWVGMTTCHQDEVRLAARELKRFHTHEPRPKESRYGNG